MNIILYGTKKCAETRKAERFFRERKIAVQFRDISETPLSPGEVKNLSAGRDALSLIDTGSPSFIKRGLAFMEYDAVEELCNNSRMLLTPVIRLDRAVYIRPVLEDLPLGHY